MSPDGAQTEIKLLLCHPTQDLISLLASLLLVCRVLLFNTVRSPLTLSLAFLLVSSRHRPPCKCLGTALPDPTRMAMTAGPASDCL